MDGGITWHEVTNNLREASGVVGIVRPGGLLIVDLLENKARSLLITTTNGVMVSFLPSKLSNNDAKNGIYWQRFGTTNEFPIVLTAALSYEHYSDTLVAATFGRGIYTVSNAKEALLDVLYSNRTTRWTYFNKNKRVKEELSSKYFPPQMV